MYLVMEKIMLLTLEVTPPLVLSKELSKTSGYHLPFKIAEFETFHYSISPPYS